MTSRKDIASAFTQEQGTIHLGGIEALVRLTLDQVRTDRRRGLKTGMFVSGYRGSPIGMLDQNLLKQQELLLEHDIHFVDGLNEDNDPVSGVVNSVKVKDNNVFLELDNGKQLGLGRVTNIAQAAATSRGLAAAAA